MLFKIFNWKLILLSMASQKILSHTFQFRVFFHFHCFQIFVSDLQQSSLFHIFLQDFFFFQFLHDRPLELWQLREFRRFWRLAIAGKCQVKGGPIFFCGFLQILIHCQIHFFRKKSCQPLWFFVNQFWC